MPKTLNSLMKHLRNCGIAIKDSAQKRKLKNIGYYHGFKGYRFIRNPSQRIPFTSLDEVIALNTFDTIIDNVLENNKTKREMFTTNLIVLTDNNKTIEITDIDSIEKITTPLIYSSISTPEWLENYDITDEYNNGIKVKINDYEYLIPGKINGVTIGNRYIISEDGKISLCFPLVSIDEYINELLGNKVDKSGGTTIIAVP